MREWKQGTWKRRQWALGVALAAAMALTPQSGALGARQDAQPAAVQAQQLRLIPGGKSLGIAIETRGLVVVGTSDLGQDTSPARLAGLDSGDIITAVNGVEVHSADELAAQLQPGKAAELQVLNGEDTRSVRIMPLQDPRDGSMRIGAWVRSGTAGVGTLSYVNPETGEFGALGHPIADADAGVTLPVADGGVYNSRIARINRGERGAPGEIVGDFLGEDEAIGEITHNTGMGIFGHSYAGDLSELPYPEGLPVARRSQVHTGSAQILTTVEDRPQAFDCEIEHIAKSDETAQRAIVLHVTDPELIEKTGGIVQGMSGSPIIQDGKLVGAVTHVLVNDPTRGYGIFIENMLDAAG